MEVRLLPSPEPHRVPLLRPLPGARLCRGFFPPPMVLLKSGGAPSRGVHKSITNITNHLRLVNNILLRISLPKTVMKSALLPGGKRTAMLVSETVDSALRMQLDRELLLMERGENIAANQRRRVMLQKNLETKPVRVVERFYSAQMRILANSPAGAQEPPGFSGDIIHEQNIRNNRTVYEQHTEQVVQGRAEASPASAREVQRIADQVIRQLDRRMKLQRDRNGIW